MVAANRKSTAETRKLTPTTVLTPSEAITRALCWSFGIRYDEADLDWLPAGELDDDGMPNPVHGRVWGGVTLFICNTEAEMERVNDEIDEQLLKIDCEALADGTVRYRLGDKISGCFQQHDRPEQDLDKYLFVVLSPQWDKNTKRRDPVTVKWVDHRLNGMRRVVVDVETHHEAVDGELRSVVRTTPVSVRTPMLLVSNTVTFRGTVDRSTHLYWFTSPTARAGADGEPDGAGTKSPSSKSIQDAFKAVYQVGDEFKTGDAVKAIQQYQQSADGAVSKEGTIRQEFKTGGKIVGFVEKVSHGVYRRIS